MAFNGSYKQKTLIMSKYLADFKDSVFFFAYINVFFVFSTFTTYLTTLYIFEHFSCKIHEMTFSEFNL